MRTSIFHTSGKRTRNIHNQLSFDMVREQVKALTPQQLRQLRGDIDNKLERENNVVITDEEAQLISSLFS
ncbi:hypothetical protein [Vibrio hepatarius]|uniref:hypothetical protein n=1 Tax=Vibrio hepatarius TaxID=171383 RepID=UPI00142E8167|nr:hypothetical protein [Vibrio hepatarius]NIY81955.1 hypothetical protein [Vibrio hepatarius]NVJ57484.1 hypothetical protein [Vibrionaceae bacterium]